MINNIKFKLFVKGELILFSYLNSKIVCFQKQY
ncbi:MAG: hypothetical protein ACI9XR_001955 [Flavobacterium sp.]|jgi:hypothetical protein